VLEQWESAAKTAIGLGWQGFDNSITKLRGYKQLKQRILPPYNQIVTKT
jgi:hypothetical protein